MRLLWWCAVTWLKGSGEGVERGERKGSERVTGGRKEGREGNVERKTEREGAEGVRKGEGARGRRMKGRE